MSVLATLTREHRLFEDLIASLRSAAEFGGPLGRARVAEALLVLLPALQRHDAIEDLVFAPRDGEYDELERRTYELVEAQHETIRALRVEIEAVLRTQAAAPWPRLATLVESLASKLEWHLKTEELLLWPIEARRSGRSVDASIARRAERGLRELEASLEGLRNAARDYVEGDGT